MSIRGFPVVASLVLQASAEEGPANQTGGGSAGADRAQVLAINDEINQAVLSGDTDVLRARLGDQFVASDPTNAIRSRDDLIALFGRGAVSYDDYSSEVDFAGEVSSGVFVVMGTETTKVHAAPGEAGAVVAGRTIRRRFTNVFACQGDDWKLIAKQSTTIEVR